MSIRERFELLEDRERRLLGIFALIVGFVLVLLIPLGVTALLHGSRSDNAGLREAIEQINASRPVVEKARAARRAIEERYARPAPPLTTFLATLAKEVEVEIPETQDRQPIPHGKRYDEKSTKISLRKIGMLKLVRLMERIEQSGYPVSIGTIDIRKRGAEPDSYDVDMVVSAFERKADKPGTKSKVKEDSGADANKESP